ncbi:hypothetical protein K470DRAFT_245062 [Piedraia hortae CBS 480.64]|uniref:DASH complex subunit ASK1 n=1 Tax=Piedraia hortae CBS 480.64 TaxID=1314780 RepID=A0A6A7C202_9PEZI|nr:hypothetical protein K470DRAFT_245062 [Piedraia hortae CBS 480.64]
MSRPRPLTLTEELERLEQSITLTLQEIDSNFNSAHRIVTSSILPIIEQYAHNSTQVWEGSKFWKQFFESSANVSLSGYDEPVTGEQVGAQSQPQAESDSATPTATPQPPVSPGDETTETGQTDETTRSALSESDSELQSPTQTTGRRSTPVLAPPSTIEQSTKRGPSPRKYTGTNPLGHGPRTPSREASLPRREASLHQRETTLPPRTVNPKNETSHPTHPTSPEKNTDPLLHRSVLDKNYRVQVTPHRNQTTTDLWSSSPIEEAPQLRSDLFSPIKQPRTPGVSVLTPYKKVGGAALPGGGATIPPGTTPRGITSTGRRLFSPQDKTFTNTTRGNVFGTPAGDGESEGEDTLFGMSPPKTMQFSIPQSRVMQTPAREASRRIVEELMFTAGVDGSDSESFVRGVGEETF